MIALPLMLFAVAVATLYGWLAGPGWSRSERLRWALAWGPAFAFGLPSCALFLARFGGLDGTGPWVVVALGLVASLTAAVRHARHTERAWIALQVDPQPTPESQSASGSRARAIILTRVSTAAGLAVLALLLLHSFRTWQRAQPAGMWDAVAIWNSSARFLARGEAARLPVAYGTQQEGHAGYPLHLAAAIAAQWGLAGSESDDVPLGVALVFTLGLGAALHLVVRRCGAPLFAGPAVLLVLSTPLVWKWAFAQVADLPLAYLALASALPLVAAIERRPALAPPAVLSGFVVALLPWTKDEGAVIAIVLVAFFLALLWRFEGAFARWSEQARTRARRRSLALLLGASPVLGALLLFKLIWAPPIAARASFVRGGGKVAQLLDFERWRHVAGETWRLLDPRTGGDLSGYLWPLLALGLILWGGRLRERRSSGALLLLAAAAALLVSYMSALVLSPFDLHWHVASAFDRLLLHLLPLAAAGVFGLAGSGEAGEADSAEN